MTDILLSMLVVAGMVGVFGLLHLNARAQKSCGLCDGVCSYEPECNKGREDGNSLPPSTTFDNLRKG